MAAVLGAAGALPFLGLTPFGAESLKALVPPEATGGALIAWALERRTALQISYGASILSFLGAVHWGLAMAAGGGALRFAYSVVPSLVAWPCAALPSSDGLKLSAGGLAAAGGVDLALFRQGLLPFWYVAGLRVPLTIIAVSSLCSSLVESEGGVSPKSEAKTEGEGVVVQP